MIRTSVACFAIALAFAGCGREETATGSGTGPREVTLRAEQVGRAESRTINPAFSLTGVTEAVQAANVVPQVSARVVANHFVGGEMVQQGKLLVELDDADYRAALATASAELQAANATLRQAQANWNRAQELMPQGYISQSDYDGAEAKVEAARAAVAQAESALEQAQLNLDRTRVTAPFTGRISPPGHAVGDLVGPQVAEPLFELVQIDPIYVTAAVEQGRYNRFVLLRQRLEARGVEVPALEVDIELAGGERYPHAGRFIAWDPSAEAAPGMIVARSQFPNPEQILLPGQSVLVEGRAVEPVTAIFIPQRAVLQDQQGHYVIVIGEDGTVRRRNLELGIRDGVDWSVSSGLAEGERLVVEGAERLVPGSRVTVAG